MSLADATKEALTLALLLLVFFIPICTTDALTCLEECITINPDGSCIIQEEFITAPFYRFLLPLDEYAKRLEKKGRVTIEEFDKGGNTHYRVRLFIEDTNKAQIGAVSRKLIRKNEHFFWDSYEYTENIAAELEPNEPSGPLERFVRRVVGLVTGDITVTKTVQMPGAIFFAGDCRSISEESAKWFFTIESRPVRILVKSKKLNWEKVVLVSSGVTILIIILSIILTRKSVRGEMSSNRNSENKK